jgi:8-oxo-dGTP pyrophosphatase MutT (NUDIX family)
VLRVAAYNREMTWRPDLTVAAVVERDGRFLVVEERIGGRLVLNQPAGHVEDGETMAEAVIRETREETAWGFTPTALLGCYLWRNPRNGRTTLRVAFHGSVDGHRPEQPLDRGIHAVHWRSRAELLAAPDRLRSPLVVRCIDDYLAGVSFELAALQSLIEPLEPTVLTPARRQGS